MTSARARADRIVKDETSRPTISLDRHLVHHGDCVGWMNTLTESSVDAIVCDPPYGLEFMGKAFDSLGEGPAMQVWHTTWLTAALRVLKPGGHIVAFSHSRTAHRLWCAAEDVGFEIRDTLFWCQAQGFPKSLDVSKAIDKAAGAEGGQGPMKRGGERLLRHTEAGARDGGGTWGDEVGRNAFTYVPSTPLAKLYDGYGTALAPSYEPVLLARKPLVGTVARNVEVYGTGGINVDACRTAAEDADLNAVQRQQSNRVTWEGGVESGFKPDHVQPTYNAKGRWPKNLLMDEGMAALLNAQTGDDNSRCFPVLPVDDPDLLRLYYTGKITTAERAGTAHPTTKPLAVMRWLVKLVSPPARDGIAPLIVDPFLGSGTTLLACEAEGVRCWGAEQSDEYLGMIAQRYERRDEIIASCDKRMKKRSKKEGVSA